MKSNQAANDEFLPEGVKGPLHVPGADVDAGFELPGPFQAVCELGYRRVRPLSVNVSVLSLVNEFPFFPKVSYLTHY